MHSNNQAFPGSASANATLALGSAPSAGTPSGGIAVAPVISRDAIRLFAYQNWEIAGRPDGDGVNFWLEAESELGTPRQDTSGRGNSQDADRHSGIRHPHSLKM